MQNFVRAARNRSFLTHAETSYWRDHEERAGTICPFFFMLYAHRQAPGKKVVVNSCIFVIIKMSMYFENGFDRCGKQKNLIDLQGWQTDKGFLALKQGQTGRE